MPGPILEVGDDLVLRTVEREDAAFLQRVFADPWARPGLHADSHKNEAEVEEFVEEHVEQDILRCRPRDVGHDDSDRVVGVDVVAETGAVGIRDCGLGRDPRPDRRSPCRLGDSHRTVSEVNCHFSVTQGQFHTDTGEASVKSPRVRDCPAAGSFDIAGTPLSWDQPSRRGGKAPVEYHETGRGQQSYHGGTHPTGESHCRVSVTLDEPVRAGEHGGADRDDHCTLENRVRNRTTRHVVAGKDRCCAE